MVTITEILNRIEELNQHDMKSKIARGLKLMEECGELAEAILSSENVVGCGYKGKTSEDVLEESVDVAIMALSVFCAHSSDKENLDQEFTLRIQQKLAKWKEKTSEPCFNKDGFCTIDGGDCSDVSCGKCAIYLDSKPSY